MGKFNIEGMVNQIGVAAEGESLQVIDITGTYNDRGDLTETKTAYSIDGIIQIMTAEEDEVIEGYLRPGDIVGFFADSETNNSYLKTGNQLYYQSVYYRIKEVIDNNGHVEVMAMKI